MNRKKRKLLKIRSKNSLVRNGIDPKGNSTITCYDGKVIGMKEFMEKGLIMHKYLK